MSYFVKVRMGRMRLIFLSIDCECVFIITVHGIKSHVLLLARYDFFVSCHCVLIVQRVAAGLI